MKTALIMEGGAMRGMFTAGVLDVFMENNISFDAAAGISAGAVFGCNFKSHQIGRAIRYNKRFSKDPRYCSIRSLIKTGDLYGADFCYRELPDELDVFDREAFRKNPMPFYVGATDLATGKAVFYNCTDGGEKDMLWMRASASMPLVSHPVQVDGYMLLDGGVAEAVPYRFMESIGCDRNVMILTQPKGYRKKKGTLTFIFPLLFRGYSAFVEAMQTRHTRYNRMMEEIDAREAEGKALVIRPPEALGIPHTEDDPAELERVYRLGRAEAQNRLAEVKRFLASGG